MAISIKYEIRSDRPRQNGDLPIRIRFTHNRKNKYISTPWSVSQKLVDADGRITDYRLDGYVYGLIREFRMKIDELGFRVDSMTVDEVIDYLKTEKEKEKPFALDFVIKRCICRG